MSYEQFKANVMEQLKRYLPPYYEDWNLEIREVPKVNGYMDGIHLMPKQGGTAIPTIYMEDLYQYYQECESITKVCQKAASIFIIGMDYAEYIDAAAYAELPKTQVIYCLINAEENQRLLENAPHRMILDMALIYRILLFNDDEGLNSAMITNEVAEHMGLNEEELYQLAECNTPRILPADVRCCDDTFALMTNQCRAFGATTLLYDGQMKAIADQLDSDLFVLPSSIHEVFLVPTFGQSIAAMNRAVIEANHTLIPPEDVLAHHIYFYDREKDILGIPVELPDFYVKDEEEV